MRNLVYAATFLAISGLLAIPTFVSAQTDSTINVVASNWKFTTDSASPGTVTVHLNQTTTLRVTSKEGAHSIGSTALGIPETILLPGKSVTLTFTPKKVGTYELHCNLPCGPGHPDMKLIVKVVE
ncbi:MAG TPA: cupredoxin domain-containing protein [Candidatus Rubrimentiphilum sp.]|nr:cupredoxin domain-containing protein [Candidatus Rubrimentiphilum sp.]